MSNTEATAASSTTPAPTASSALRQRKGRLKLANVVKQVTMMNASEREQLRQGQTQGQGQGSLHQHTRRASDQVPYQDLDRNRGSNANTNAHSHFRSLSSNIFSKAQLPEMTSDTSNLLDNAEHMEQLFQMGPHSELFNQEEEQDYFHNEPPDEERPHSSRNQETSPLLQQQQQAASRTQGGATTTRRPKWWTNLMIILAPQEMIKAIKSFLLYWVLGFMIPCLLAAAFVFYYLGNPEYEYLPTGLSWFLLLLVRLSVTFNLARMSQWIMQLMTIKTGALARFAGPFVALIAMQSQGWPCILSFWGIWNLILLHGSGLFIRHWLYFTHIRLFSVKYNFGNGFLSSEIYERMLFSVLFFGITVSIKRTLVALFLSRRMLQFYRPQLEVVMAQVKIIMEVAELAQETEREGFGDMLNTAKEAAQNRVERFAANVPTFEPAKAMAVETSYRSTEDEDDDDDDADTNTGSAKQQEGKGKEEDEEGGLLAELEATGSEVDDDDQEQWEALKQRALNDRYTMKFYDAEDEHHHGHGSGQRKRSDSLKRSSSRGLDMIYPFLERWQEPEDKGSKKVSATLHDILQFKKAMSFLNGELNLVAKSFGETPNRRALVKNAARLYRRLLRFTPDQAVLSFDVIGALAYHSDGSLDEERAIAFLRVFLPDKDNKIPMLAFIQAVDHIYKKMRFLRASLSNSSKIDGVLENVFNVIFYAILFLSCLSTLGYNPWPILLSFSTFAISFAFAFGSSVAKALEGVLLIAVRRPYDIGDRISICGAESVSTPGFGDTWIIEDISLTTTTMRYAATNEVATINNASIASSRIVNGSRSPKASITFRILFDIEKATPEKIDEFRQRIETYLENRPRIWISPLIHYRTEQVDSDNGFVLWLYRAQHVKSWQELGPIMVHKGELERYADTLATEMDIILSTPPRRMTIGLGVAPASNDPQKNLEDRERMQEFLRSLKE